MNQQSVVTPNRQLALTLAITVAAVGFGAVVGRTLLHTANDPADDVLAALHANRSPDDPSPALPQRRVVVALIDGLGASTFEGLLNDREIEPPSWHAYLDVGAPSLSRPVYHMLLTGVPQSVSGIRTNAHEGRARADSVADRVRAAGGSVAWALEYVPWFADLFSEPADAIVLGPSAVDPVRFEELYESGAELLVLHVVAPDLAGHEHGGNSRAYREAARSALRTVLRLRDGTRGHTDFGRTVWFVGADHGHMPRGGHGGPEHEVRQVLWVALSAARVPYEPLPARYFPAGMLAPTIAAVLGVAPPAEAVLGPLPTPWSDATRDDGVVRGRRASTVQSAFDARARRSLRSRTTRGMLVGMIALGLGVLAVRRGQGRRMAGAVLVVAGAAAGFALVGPGFTLSAIRTEAAFLVRSVAAMAVGTALVWSLARRVGARWRDSMIAAAVAVALAFVAVGGSLGRGGVDAIALALLPTTGLFPAGVALGATIGERWVRARRRTPRT